MIKNIILIVLVLVSINSAVVNIRNEQEDADISNSKGTLFSASLGKPKIAVDLTANLNDPLFKGDSTSKGTLFSTSLGKPKSPTITTTTDETTDLETDPYLVDSQKQAGKLTFAEIKRLKQLLAGSTLFNPQSLLDDPSLTGDSTEKGTLYSASIGKPKSPTITTTTDENTDLETDPYLVDSQNQAEGLTLAEIQRLRQILLANPTLVQPQSPEGDQYIIV